MAGQLGDEDDAQAMSRWTTSVSLNGGDMKALLAADSCCASGDGQATETQRAAAALHATTGSKGSPPRAELWPALAPRPVVPSAPPPGMDAAAYAAGERAAWLAAFHAALPGQQALGSLAAAVEGLQARLGSEAERWRALEADCARVTGALEAAGARLDGLERREAGGVPQAEVVGALRALQGTLAALGRQQAALAAAAAAAPPLASAPGLTRGLAWLVAAAAGYGRAALSRADVAALFLSRKLLLTDLVGEPDAGQPPRSAPRLALGCLLFVAAVEAAWQAHERLVWARTPRALRPGAAPLRAGLRASRAAVWSAAGLLAAVGLRRGCQAASDRACRAAGAAAGVAAGWLAAPGEAGDGREAGRASADPERGSA